MNIKTQRLLYADDVLGKTNNTENITLLRVQGAADKREALDGSVTVSRRRSQR